MNHAKCYIKGYPRPQFVRDDYTILNGNWAFRFDENNEGDADKWWQGFVSQTEINVPYAYQTESSGVNCKDYVENIWYCKQFDFSKQSKNKNVYLNFEGSDYITKVWVNGVYVGQNEGGYHRFSFDITSALKNGFANIVIKCTDTYSAAQPRGKQRWRSSNFGCWYTETSGIWKTVWAEFTSDSFLDSVKVLASTDDYFAQLDYKINNFASGLTIKTIITFKGALVSETISKVVRDNFLIKVNLTGEVAEFKVHTWLAHSPNIYDIEYVLYKDDKEIDRVKSYFGLKKYATVNNVITANDYPLYLKMTLDQGYFEGGFLTPTEEQIVADIQLTKELGFNGIRKHQKIEDELFYYYCDILGVYVWLEMPSHYEFSDELMQRFVTEYVAVLRQYQNFACIMTVIPFNESWGVQRIFSDKQQQHFTESIYHLTKSILPSTLVISNDGWEHTKSDIISIHHYAENAETLGNVFEDMEAVISNKKTLVGLHKFCFANGYAYEGQPIMLTEYAGIAFEKDKKGDNWGYGNMVKDEDQFIKRLDGLTKAIYKNKAFCGFCITQTTDVENEVNGLADFSRKLKVNKTSLSKIINND